MFLKKNFKKLFSNYTKDKRLIEMLWLEIVHNYSNENRHYHTLSHLEDLLHQLFEVKSKIESWETILFTLYYHDFIYSTKKTDNEEKSAEYAERIMKQIGVPNQIIENCKLQIIATKKHDGNSDLDTKYFLDADLSILGTDRKTFSIYSKNIKKEYSKYSDFAYNKGRIKVLNHYLVMDRIYKTDIFHAKYEKQAKQNIQSELHPFKADKRREIIINEIKQQGLEHQCDKFEYSWDICAYMCTGTWSMHFLPYKPIDTPFNDIVPEDLDYLEMIGEIILIKEYKEDELYDETGRREYRINYA